VEGGEPELEPIRARARRTWGQRGVLALNAAGAVGCLLAAVTLTWTWDRVSEIPRIDLGTELSVEDEDEGEEVDGRAQNVLIVGTDTAAGLDTDDPVQADRPPTVRSDTIMLLRVDPSSSRADLLSIPRDLYVPISGTDESSRINAAILGGPGRLVATLTDALDLPVHHYLEVDLAGFRELVEVLDGVPMYFPRAVRDRRSGLFIERPGCVTLDPEQALALARSRAYEVYRNGEWELDPTSDIGRIARQQEFIRQSLGRAFQQGARNPTVLLDLVEAGVGAVTLDDTLTLADLSAIALRFRSFDPDALVTHRLEVSDDVVGGAQVLRLDAAASQPVLDIFRGIAGGVTVDNTVVRVENGSGVVGLAASVADELRALGFVVPPDGAVDAESTDVAATTLRFAAGGEARADLVRRGLDADPVLDPAGAHAGAHVVVTIGADWTGVGAELRAPAAADPSATTTTSPSAPTPPATTTTSTSLPPGVVPGDAPDGGSC
jgi:LCP family protein required for cell wall assembly